MYSLSHKVKWKKMSRLFLCFFYSVIYEKYNMQKLPAKTKIKHIYSIRNTEMKNKMSSVVPYSSSSYTKGN